MILKCVCSLKNLNRSHLQLKRAHSLGYYFSMDLTFSLQYIHLLLVLQCTIFASYVIEKSFPNIWIGNLFQERIILNNLSNFQTFD